MFWNRRGRRGNCIGARTATNTRGRKIRIGRGRERERVSSLECNLPGRKTQNPVCSVSLLDKG